MPWEQIHLSFDLRHRLVEGDHLLWVPLNSPWIFARCWNKDSKRKSVNGEKWKRKTFSLEWVMQVPGSTQRLSNTSHGSDICVALSSQFSRDRPQIPSKGTQNKRHKPDKPTRKKERKAKGEKINRYHYYTQIVDFLVQQHKKRPKIWRGRLRSPLSSFSHLQNIQILLVKVA